MQYGGMRRGDVETWERDENGNGSKYEEGIWIGERNIGGGILSEKEEKMLGRTAWNLPIVLQRFDVAFWRKGELLKELTSICQVLLDGWSEERGMAIVCPESCRVRMIVATGNLDGWGKDMMSKMLLVLAGWERELLVTESMSGILEYAYISRFLTWRAIKNLKKEKAEVWASFADEGRAEQREQRRTNWLRELELEHGDVLQLVDKPWAWETIAETTKRGEEALEDLIRDMLGYEERGGKLAVSLISKPEENRSEEYTRSIEEEADVDQGSESEFSDIQYLNFQSHRSCIDARELSAYIDLVTQLITYIQSMPYGTLGLKIQNFRYTSENIDDSPHSSFLRLLRILDVQQSTLEWYTYKTPYNNGPIQIQEQDRDTPFYQVQRHINSERRKDVEYIPTLLRRYEEAGGFHVPTRAKIHSLLLAEDLKHSERKRRSRLDEKVEAAQSAKRMQNLRTPNWLPGMKGLTNRKESGTEEKAEIKYEIGAQTLVASQNTGSAGEGIRNPEAPVSPVSPSGKVIERAEGHGQGKARSRKISYRQGNGKSSES